ncbi:MAG: exo-alpha-sialidase [Ruminococcaceae bacterium]|nr:exo-alpha-sialidase [Oscillospiraceae bacterium]
MTEETKRVIEESKRGFGKDNAKEACPVLYRPEDKLYKEEIRLFQGCPTVAVTEGGRIYLGWYAGGTGEPRLENYNLLIYSDDGGKTFSEPLIVIPSDKERMVHALDIQLWRAPDGAIWLFWVQNNVRTLTADNEYMLSAMQTDKRPVVTVEGNIYPDMRHTEWCIVCKNPDDENPEFSEPRLLDIGFLRCKPTVLSDGRWFFPNYDQLTDNYGYSISKDEGKSFTRYYGSEKLPTGFDETMVYEKNNGDIRMLARCAPGELAETTSHDGAESWSETKLSGIDSPSTRFFISRTPTGKVILVNNDSREGRTRMSVWLSDDDGDTWKYKKTVGNPEYITSYPDVDFFEDKIYLTYDRGRTKEREIYFSVFTEADIMNPKTELEARVISRGTAPLPEKTN